MTYELAKELKDAGFPQDLDKCQAFYDSKGELYRIGDTDGFSPWDDAPDGSKHHTPSSSGCGCCSGRLITSNAEVVVAPTLEELIEACGEGYDGLYRGGEKGWWATNGHGTASDGLTPIEAVARLWLALNKKDAN